jgi:hypothetical protein
MLKQLRDAEAEELRQLKIDNEALVGALHQAQMENRKLREELAAPGPRLRAILGAPHLVGGDGVEVDVELFLVVRACRDRPQGRCRRVPLAGAGRAAGLRAGG